MKALIIAAHGSRKKESNLEIASLVERLSKKTSGSFDMVVHAFLQFADPLIEKKIDELVEKGVEKLVIFPFFLGSGSHILVDIPELVKKAQTTHGHVEFQLTRHLGKIEAIEDVILKEVTG
ncbi:sirohydrochlorin chelatase [Desulfobacula toluolica]|uniref:CbiX: sirohydrochlorin cobaltochelatase n=1 Tax=Desulfobacula toluolica (strain DSM 7467 / Tol2) TaxID=651182 RepID=K0NDN6_DESTT|nr:CbiX/SirB N-terminal domain-containing protein [Desulfobacula toluolica]CCK78910.1 CbiX: sirohydrochlorin cobaltochelatase [Desulfobacula toluolica Tol2]